MIVTFILSDPTADSRPLYIFSNPHFETYSECYTYVQKNSLNLYNVAIASYNLKYKPEHLYCINEKAMKDILEYTYGKKQNEKEV